MIYSEMGLNIMSKMVGMDSYDSGKADTCNPCPSSSANYSRKRTYYKEVQKLLDKHKVDGGVDWSAVCLELFNTDNPVIPEQELDNDQYRTSI
jgi:hypothetical protein